MAKLISANLTNNKLCTIQYTTTDGKMLSINSNSFDAEVVSHAYTHIGTIIFANPLTTIGNRAFYGCNILKSISFPEGVTTIGDEAFKYCHSLISVIIPNSVVSIGVFTTDYYSIFYR